MCPRAIFFASLAGNAIRHRYEVSVECPSHTTDPPASPTRSARAKWQGDKSGCIFFDSLTRAKCHLSRFVVHNFCMRVCGVGDQNDTWYMVPAST